MGKRDELWYKFKTSIRKHISRSSGPLQTPSEEREHDSLPGTSQNSPGRARKISPGGASARLLSQTRSTDDHDDLKFWVKWSDSYAQPEELWKDAFEQVLLEDRNLVQAYNEILTQETGMQGYGTQALAQEVLKLKRTQVLNRQWRLSWRNKTLEVGKAFDNLAKLFIMFKDVGASAASADPVHAALPWAGILLLLIPIANHHEQYKHMLEGLEQVTELVVLYYFTAQFRITGEAFRPSKKPRDPFKPLPSYQGLDEKFATEIVKLYAQILKYQMKAACDLNRSTLSTFLRNIPKIDDWKGMMQEVYEQSSQCQRYETLNFNAQAKLRDEKLAAQKKTEDIEMIVFKISQLDVERDHENVRYRLSDAYWGSGQWFFSSNEFTEWERKPDSVLWLQGPVGVGKSCLTSSVIERILSSVTVEQVAFFYCSEQRSELQANSTSIKNSILAQLARDAKGDLAPSLKDWYHSIYGDSFRTTKQPENNLRSASKPFLSRNECSDLLEEILASGGQKILIIDGLDECKDPATLIEYFDKVHIRSKNTKFFFSSRFGIRPDHQFGDAILVEHLNNSADVENYITKELESPRRIAGSGIKDAQRKELRTLLLRHARGMFRWVELWLDLILSPEQKIRHCEDIQEKLEKLRNFSKDPSREATASLDELYFDLFKRNTYGGHNSRGLAVKALQLLLSAFKPLSMDSLVQAVALKFEGDTDGEVDERFILGICSNFITITKSGTVRLAHRSVKEYLVHSHDLYVKREFQSVDESFTEHSVRAQAAETCITFILSLGEPSWKHVPTDAKTPLSSVVTLSGFELYACLFWPAHCEKVGKSQKTERYESQFTSLLDTGATTACTAFRRWIHLLWVYFNSPKYDSEGRMREQLEDAVSQPPNPFLVTCIFGFHGVAQELLTREPNLANSHNIRGKSALYLAAENGHCETVKLLIESGANVKEAHRHWRSITCAAAWGSNLDAFRLVAEKIRRLDDDVLDAALSGGNERLVLDALGRDLDVRLSKTPRKTDHVGNSRSAYSTEKKTSLRLSKSAVRAIEYDRLKFDIILPIEIDYVNPQLDHIVLQKDRLALLQALELANIRRYEIINCFRRVNGDHEQKFGRLCHPGESLEPNGLEEIESRITKDSQKEGNTSKRSKDFIASYWRSQKLPEIPPVSDFSVGGRTQSKCPICYTSELGEEVGFPEEWRKHIMNDLRPYICPFIPECSERSLLFRDVVEWEDHIEQQHGSKEYLFQPPFKQSNLEADVNFNLDKYLAENGDGLDNNGLEYLKGWMFGSSPTDVCPLCFVNLFPIYRAGIESRERHVARHLENVALSILQQDDDPIIASELSDGSSDHTQSDRKSIQSWSSCSSSSVGTISIQGRKGSGADGDDGTAFSRVDNDVSSSPVRGQLRMDMTALRDGNDDMLSVHPWTQTEDSGIQDTTEYFKNILALD